MIDVVPLTDSGLGNHSYVVGLGDGSALVVDPARSPGPYLEVARRRGWRLRFAAETHLHADFVSGARELAAAANAQVLVSAGAPVDFPARLLGNQQKVDLGGLTLRALATPGHTPEHLAYLLLDGGAPVAVFTGGALIAGGVARPDLLGPELTEPLARAAWRSLHDRLLALPDEVAVHPTHGAGSFCSTTGGDVAVTTIGAARTNPALRAPDEDAFVARLLGGLGSYPPYFLELRDVNRAGPAVYGPQPPALPQLEADEVQRLRADGAEIVDVRDVAAFAAGHVPGSLSNPLRPAFATWLGWLVARDRPLVFVTGDGTDRHALLWACLGIGYERLAGELRGGVDAWRSAGREVAAIPLLRAAEVGDREVVDVRQATEWADGHVPGARHVELGAVPQHAAALAGRPLLVHCAHGERAMTAASLLARAGIGDVAALDGGPQDLAAVRGAALEPAA